MPFDYLLAQAKIESSLDPSAQAKRSSAAGLYQFTRGTWLQTLGRHGAEHGLDVAAGPALRARTMALRLDPEASALMAGELANDNRALLSVRLGRDPDAAELYLAHFLGAGGAGRFLTALADNPQGSAAALLPQAAAANPTVFYDRGAPRSVGQVMDLLRGRMDAAMADTSRASPSVSPDPPPSLAAPPTPAAMFHLAASTLPAPPAGGGSMTALLDRTFGLSERSGANAPAAARAAYDRMRALGL